MHITLFNMTPFCTKCSTARVRRGTRRIQGVCHLFSEVIMTNIMSTIRQSPTEQSACKECPLYIPTAASQIESGQAGRTSIFIPRPGGPRGPGVFFLAASRLRGCSASLPAGRMMVHVRESGTAIAAASGALWAAATCGPLSFPPAPPPLLPGLRESR